MDAIQLLKAQHREVDRLFAECDTMNREDVEARKRLSEQLFQLLTVHTRIEEDHFYPKFREAAKGNSEDTEAILEALEEHHLIKTELQEFQQLYISEERCIAKLKVLKELVQHHVQDEEQEIFPHAQRILQAQLDVIGTELQAESDQLMKEGARLTVSFSPEEQVHRS